MVYPRRLSFAQFVVLMSDIISYFLRTTSDCDYSEMVGPNYLIFCVQVALHNLSLYNLSKFK